MKYFNKRLYEPYCIKEIGGSRLLFIGVITAEMSRQLIMEKTVGAYIEVRDPVEEINRILAEFDLNQFTMVAILSHIGIEEDIKMAQRLDSEKIGLIIGRHSHTLLEKPLVVNDIPIVQAGTGTGQIGRFDIWYHPEDKSVEYVEWHTVTIDSEHCPVDDNIASTVRAA